MTETNLEPKRITDIIDNIDIYLAEMRKRDDKIELPKHLTDYIWNFFRDVNPDKEKLQGLSVFLVDHIYRYTQVDDYSRIYFASVITKLWDAIQDRGVDTFYILDNEIREDRLMLTIQLFALSGVAVVTPYAIKDSYQKYMTLEEQAKWVLSFDTEDFDPKKYTITIDGGGDVVRGMDVIDLLKEYMRHTRNIAYIEKDDSVNYLEEVQQLAKDSKYMSVLRNKAPDDPNVIVINQ
jgi:hypothetical protein